MDVNAFPTKGNLIATKNSLLLANQGFDLMDKKRNVLISEVTKLIDEAKKIQGEIDSTFAEAYSALQNANIDLGIYSIKELSFTIPIDDNIKIKSRSVMGTEIPLVEYSNMHTALTFSFGMTTENLDKAILAFKKVKLLTIRLSQIENSAYRLADSIRKSRKRANALKNITIPKYEALEKSISEALEEKEREEFTRLKVIKKRMNA